MEFDIISSSDVPIFMKNIDEKFIWIGIFNNNYPSIPEIVLPPNGLGVVKVQFDNIDEIIMRKNKVLKPITLHDARHIIDFFSMYMKKIDRAIVSCSSGNFRSPAVSEALSIYFFGKSLGLGNKFTLNEFVRDTILREGGLHG